MLVYFLAGQLKVILDYKFCRYWTNSNIDPMMVLDERSGGHHSYAEEDKDVFTKIHYSSSISWPDICLKTTNVNLMFRA